MLSQQRELFRRWRRLEPDAASVFYAVRFAQRCDLMQPRLRECVRQISAAAISALISRNELRPVARQHRHEVLTSAVAQVQHTAPQPGGARGASGPDDLFDLIR